VVGDHKLEIDPIVDFGYLTVTTDAKTMNITFKTAHHGGPVTQRDFVTLDLVKGKITASGSKPAPKPPKPQKPPRKKPPKKKKH
jgi:hypothetical protein